MALKGKNEMVKLSGNIKNNEEVINILKEIAGIDLINGEFKAQINSKQRNKMLSNKAVDKSIKNGFNKELHLLAVSMIDTIFANSKFLGRFDDIKNKQNDLKILRFENVLYLNNHKTKVLITAKETQGKKNIVKLYSLELIAD